MEKEFYHLQNIYWPLSSSSKFRLSIPLRVVSYFLLLASEDPGCGELLCLVSGMRDRLVESASLLRLIDPLALCTSTFTILQKETRKSRSCYKMSQLTMASVLNAASLLTGLFSLFGRLPEFVNCGEFLLLEGSSEDKPVCLPLSSPTTD